MLKVTQKPQHATEPIASIGAVTTYAVDLAIVLAFTGLQYVGLVATEVVD